LGLLGLLLFLLWLILHIWQMFRLSRRPGWSGEYAAVLFATFCALGVVWAGEGLIVWTQMMMPIWFLFAMADQLNRLSSSEQVPQPSG
jgi:O-antigen ligase